MKTFVIIVIILTIVYLIIREYWHKINWSGKTIVPEVIERELTFDEIMERRDLLELYELDEIELEDLSDDEFYALKSITLSREHNTPRPVDDDKLIVSNIEGSQKIISFYKEYDGRWFVYLLDYPGSKIDLQMVGDANTFIEKITGISNECTLTISETEFEGSEVLKLITGFDQENELLCTVIKYVFGRLPKVIYFKK